eukprot:scaffold17064_cov52-Phaeocystis_antarctica.AAC.2
MRITPVKRAQVGASERHRGDGIDKPRVLGIRAKGRRSGGRRGGGRKGDRRQRSGWRWRVRRRYENGNVG